MENLPLHRKYRPQTFDEFLGNDSIISTLKSVLKKNQVKSFLFYGPSGCGKTTLARIVRDELVCSPKDFYEYDLGNTRGIDTVREIIANSIYAPINGKVKIYLMDEAHKLTPDAQGALLKILEDTPDHIRFILCTTDPDKLIVTIRNRCDAYQVYPLITPTMSLLLRKVCKAEGFDIKPTILREINKVSNGCPRQALLFLEKISDITDDNLALAAIGEGLIDESKTIELCRALLKKDWSTVADLLKGLKQEPETIRYAILGYFSTVLLGKGDDRTAGIMATFTESFMYSGRAGLILACYLACQ